MGVRTATVAGGASKAAPLASDRLAHTEHVEGAC